VAEETYLSANASWSRMSDHEKDQTNSWRISEDGRIHRKRHKVFPNGDIYHCEFVDNVPDGLGTLVTVKGMRYEGSFSKGLFHGNGTIVWEGILDGKKCVLKKFTGQFKNGKKNGVGTFHENGNRWEGSFVDDVFSGKGSLWKANGERQEGTWRNGKLHCDDGLIIYANGDKYEGPVYLGNMHGAVGHYTYAKQKGFYTGQHQLG